MFFHILKLQRHVFWQFCGQAFAAYPLEEIDSIDVHTGQIKTTNALSVVAFGVSINQRCARVFDPTRRVKGCFGLLSSIFS